MDDRDRKEIIVVSNFIRSFRIETRLFDGEIMTIGIHVSVFFTEKEFVDHFKDCILNGMHVLQLKNSMNSLSNYIRKYFSRENLARIEACIYVSSDLSNNVVIFMETLTERVREIVWKRIIMDDIRNPGSLVEMKVETIRNFVFSFSPSFKPVGMSSDDFIKYSLNKIYRIINSR